ncbi:MAG: ubiquinol oxidase subunit II [Candidatus Liptonbacteria bacterium]|nr:ubiquinol oxidase subunit II [Candidatus Liptonbacteria bacterium]
MNPKSKFVFLILFTLSAVILFTLLIGDHTVAILNPKGSIGLQERNLILTAVLLMSIVVIPVFILTAIFASKYRASKSQPKYAPDLDHHPIAAPLMWAIPIAVISILAVINWRSTHALDPSKPLESEVKPLTIQVVALNWKWLFIYPEQNIATVNFIEFPERAPLNFELTADAPMNSFWIPELGGQMYAMAGMKTQLHLIANEVGEFAGSAAEINGAGFAGMRFVAKSTSQSDFESWVQGVQQSSSTLDLNAYNILAEPSENNPVAYYSSAEKNLYNEIIMKFMPASLASSSRERSEPTAGMPSSTMPNMDMPSLQ